MKNNLSEYIKKLEQFIEIMEGTKLALKKDTFHSNIDTKYQILLQEISKCTDEERNITIELLAMVAVEKLKLRGYSDQEIIPIQKKLKENILIDIDTNHNVSLIESINNSIEVCKCTKQAFNEVATKKNINSGNFSKQIHIVKNILIGFAMILLDLQYLKEIKDFTAILTILTAMAIIDPPPIQE